MWRIDPEVCQVDEDDGTCDKMAPEVHQADTGDGIGDWIDMEFFRLIDSL